MYHIAHGIVAHWLSFEPDVFVNFFGFYSLVSLVPLVSLVKFL